MRGFRGVFAGKKSRIAAVLVLASGLGLAACSDMDEMLFADDSGVSDMPDASADQAATPPGSMPGSLPGTLPGAVTSGPANALVPTITPVSIAPGSETGTAVNRQIQGLRATIAGLQGKIAANAQRLADLRNSAAGAASSYYDSKARITARLQVGTTRGNPELVAQWNAAQTSLDALTVNINSLNALGSDVASDSSTANYALDQIQATYNVSGAVDEDHRQLSELEDETNQTIVLINRLMKFVSEDVQRQTAYVANERANLTTLAAAIKNGELYGSDMNSPLMMSAGGAGGGARYAGTPLVVIRFDRPGVDYQQILYAALSQALQSRPSAGFEVVAVSPTRGSAAAVQLAQSSAKAHAQEVMRSMTDMGVPATRLAVAATTDPAAQSSEVRVFVR
jgi:hypothetical protein